MKSNLKYLKEFLEDTFGAVCFYNCHEDGYTSFTDKDKQMETLLIVFPSFLDLNNNLVKERIEKQMGENYYNEKQDFSSLTPLFGGSIIYSLTYKNTTRTFYENICDYPLIQEIADYFLNNESRNVMIKDSYHFQILPTLNDFAILPNKTLKQCIEDYLISNNLPLVTKENGFYVVPQLKNQNEVNEYIKKSHDLIEKFEPEINKIKKLNQNLKSSFSEQFSNLSEQQKQQFVKQFFFTNYEKPNICADD